MYIHTMEYYEAVKNKEMLIVNKSSSIIKV